MKNVYKTITSLVIIILATSTYVHAEENNERNSYYYILVDRFQNSNEVSEEGIDRDDAEGFHGGDFLGIAERIDHIDNLGISHVILSPIFDSESYTGERVQSLDEIQPTYGDETDLQEVVTQLNDSDMNAVLQIPLGKMAEQVDWSTQENQEYLIERLRYLSEEIGVTGFYFEDINSLSDSFWETLSQELDSFMIGSLSDEEANVENMLEVGFDRVLHPNFHEDAQSIFYDIETDVTPLLDDLTYNREVVHYMDHYDTDRFTRAMEESGLHPITRWKIALTYLYMSPNEPWLYQGDEIPMDGVQEDLSHHQTMNFLSGDDQIERHIEKLASVEESFEAVERGETTILYNENNMLVFEHVLGEERVITAINNSPTLQRYDMEHLEEGLELRGFIENDLIREEEDGTYAIALERESTNVYAVQADQGINWALTLIFGGVMGIFVVFAVTMYVKNRRNMY
ncbi:alpha-amylase family protein [Halalkalibacillus halophilus]|uniref:alpha-amylase family protein n=1 Tax=Halalkalibacillus halophilus TaxID=392827 RepID=UPI000413E9B4|nr:alpha-amylase family protein [Halalkalibacillus halophilus]